MFDNENGSFKSGKLIKILWVISTLAVGIETGEITAIAAGNTPHPIENPQPDPLLPSSDRPLSAFEIGRIEREIEGINREAEAQLAAGNIDGAFTLWYRELRLQRSLGRLKEVAALGRIGDLAWQQNRGFDTRAIAERLAEIRTVASAEGNLTASLLQELGTAYQQVRYHDRAIEIYQQILANLRPTGSTSAEIANLQVLGELYQDVFDYAKAAEVYEQLLTLTDDETIYLTKLATIYDRTQQIENAIAIKTRLATKYSQTQNTAKLAAVNLAIARDYQRLDNSKKAIDSYQRAYNLAVDSQQLALAIETLGELARLHQQQGLVDRAIATYKEQIKLQRQAYDYYGWMETCDRLGKIYWDLENYSQAKAFYRQGLKLAQSLNYRIGYFTERLEQIE